jgi:hypothetical protein
VGGSKEPASAFSFSWFSSLRSRGLKFYRQGFK